MVQNYIAWMNSLPSEGVLFIEFSALLCLLLGLLYFFRETGVFIFIVVTMITANLQVLKLVEYTFYPEPIALGKMAICFTFLGSDILAECYGRKSAYRGVFLGFSVNLSLMILMLITIGYPPLLSTKGVNFHENLQMIFTPIPGVFFAGVFSFVLSQILDIKVFLKLKSYFQGKYVWFRAFFSTVLASLIDNILFYTLAMYILNDFGIDLSTLIYSYIIGTFIFRTIIIAFSSFIMYAGRLIVKMPEISWFQNPIKA